MLRVELMVPDEEIESRLVHTDAMGRFEFYVPNVTCKLRVDRPDPVERIVNHAELDVEPGYHYEIGPREPQSER